MTSRPELLFVSPRFLFPADTGGAIRTTEILRNMRGGHFRVKLVSPAAPDGEAVYRKALGEIADEWDFWPARRKVETTALQRAPLLASALPVSVAADRSDAGRALVASALAQRPQAAVFDFAHSDVLAPRKLPVPAVLFTHNVEAEIFERNLEHAKRIWQRLVWRDQLRKMRRFEGEALRRFDCIVAVSTRDAERLVRDYGVSNVAVIPTGVNVDYFAYEEPAGRERVVFTGSMDWLANVDAIAWFQKEVWPLVVERCPAASMSVVGRNPPTSLTKANVAGWTFTGRVDDIRPNVQRADVFVIPLRIGGGTRIKAFEAMAMGIPVVSTRVGVEGLDVKPGEHFLLADSATDFAEAVVSLLRDAQLRLRLAKSAREHVSTNFSNAAVAAQFEAICLRTSEAATRGS